MGIGEQIRKQRLSKGLTQDELGALVHIDGRQISRYENGKVQPTAKILRRFAEAFSVSLESLTGPLMEPDIAASSFRDQELYQQMLEVDQLDEDDRYVAKKLLHALVMKKQLADLLAPPTKARRSA